MANFTSYGSGVQYRAGDIISLPEGTWSAIKDALGVQPGTDSSFWSQTSAVAQDPALVSIAVAFAQTPYNAEFGDVVIVDATAGNVVINLPARPGLLASVRVVRTDASGSTCTVTAAGGALPTALLITSAASKTLRSKDGTNWVSF